MDVTKVITTRDYSLFAALLFKDTVFHISSPYRSGSCTVDYSDVFNVEGKKCFARHTLKAEGYKIMEYINETNDFEKVKTLITDQTADTFKDFSLDIFDEAGL